MTMPTTIADMSAELSGVIDPIVPLSFVGLAAAFGAIIGAGALLVRRLSKSLR